jgi:phosphoribosyl 1,2-cyclic phosphodiesterase
MTCRLTLWGARGSIPTPGPMTARYGGNTACVTLQTEGSSERSLIILDAGTGIRPLGRALVEASREPLVADLLISHTHWDHIQGLPFFAPFYDERSKIRIRGPKQGKVSLERILRDQMNPVVFPVPLHQLDASLSVTHVESETFELGAFEVRTLRMRHPGNTLAYRLTPRAGGPSVVFAPDNELGPGGKYEVGPHWRDEFVAFLADADLVVHDAMFTADEMEQFAGWGHSSAAEAVALALDAGVRRLVLFHHRPERTDDALDELFADACQRAARGNENLEVIAGFEGLEISL